MALEYGPEKPEMGMLSVNILGWDKVIQVPFHLAAAIRGLKRFS